ncbi:MAG: CBS domain-containing protein [Nitrospirota bacterium]
MPFIGEFFVSEVLNKPVLDPSGEEIGKLRDMPVATGEVFPHITGLILSKKKKTFLLECESLNMFNKRIISSRVFASSIREYEIKETDLLIIRDILDKQIVDINGIKVVRVNDVKISEVDGCPCMVAVDIGFSGILRRLGVEKRWLGKMISYRIPHNLISWNYIQPIEPKLARLSLTVTRQAIGGMHPADIAHIISQVPEKERAAIFHTLDAETAAEALHELEPTVQASIIGGLDKRQASNIIQEMPPDEAADLLADLPAEKAMEFIGLMEREDAEELQELLSHDEDTAGGLMTTEYIAYPPDITVADAMERFRKDATEVETIYYIYVTEADEKLIGVISLRELLLALPETTLSEIMTTQLKTISPLTDEKEVAETISKYNLVALPVVDDKDRLLGIVTVDDILDFIVPTEAKRKRRRV